MKGKAGKTQNWLPTQVAWGMDTSAEDPKDWKGFGTHFEAQKAPEPKKPQLPDPKT